MSVNGRRVSGVKHPFPPRRILEQKERLPPDLRPATFQRDELKRCHDVRFEGEEARSRVGEALLVIYDTLTEGDDFLELRFVLASAGFVGHGVPSYP
jgi:hypothetical protein